MSRSFPGFGIWTLVHGSRAALQYPAEPQDASWARNKALVLEAERLGFDSVLVAQHTVNPHDPTLDQLERRGRPRPLWRRSPRASFARSPRVGSNGGTAAGLVGDYDTVARRIAEFDRAGVELFMLEFQPFEDDMRRFAQELVPRVRRELAA